MRAVLQLALVWLYVAHSALGVKDYLFKDCDSSGFCHRNRNYAKNIAEYNLPYAVDKSTIVVRDVTENMITGTIVKQLPQSDQVKKFPFKISVFEGSILRFTADEVRPDIDGQLRSDRYNETGKWALKGDSVVFAENAQAKMNLEGVVTIQMDDNTRAEFDTRAITIKVYHEDQLQIVVNERSFLNMEHYRARDENELNLLPFESDFDMFADSHNTAAEDTVPLGPESIGLDFTFVGYKHVFGVPEHADSMSLKDTSQSSWPYRLFNVDIFEYETDSRMPMYGSIPLMMATKPEKSCAVFWMNAADTFIDIKKTEDVQTHWMSESGQLDFFIIVGKTPADINALYGGLTGYAALPPMFSLGYHQCRWNYNDEKDVLDITTKMDETLVPYDTIWLDVEYADSKKYFTWNEDSFPDPNRMLQALDRTGRNLVIIIDPHLKVGYYVSDEVRKRKIGMRDAKNETFHGHCWPGESVWIDTFNPAAREYWDSLFVLSQANKVMGEESTNLHIWNDMNEPSVFDGPETSAPRDTIFCGNWEHRSVHNVYSMTFHEATFEAMSKRLKDTPRQRPFILTRAFFAGSQRTAAMWTGDNMAKWEYLEASIPMVLSAGIAGMPFAGADVGGFFGNPSKELLTRWYQTGIWYPFFRAHAHIDSRRREPWVPGEPYTGIIRDAVRLRYALLPTLYTCFHELSTNGLPVMKPMFYDAPDNEATYDIDDQFYVGNSGLLVKPVTAEGSTSTSVYLPDRQVYYEFFNGAAGKAVKGPQTVEMEADLATIPMYLKGGSIVTIRQRYRRSTKLMARDPFTLVVALDNDGNASGRLHLDDGESYAYRDGHQINLKMTADPNGVSCDLESGSRSEYLTEMQGVKIEKIVLLGATNVEQVEVEQNGHHKTISVLEGQIANPGLAISSPWRLRFMRSLSHDEL